MHRLDLSYIGSFQRGRFIDAEKPVEEVWDQVAQLGIPAINESLSAGATPPVKKPWSEWGGYATARARQAVEFRAATKTGSILTQPLPLYYSFLNLVRGAMAMIEQVISAKGHGMRFHPHSDILQSRAEFTKGTFLDYMGVLKMPATIGDSISLEECFRAIPEMQDTYIMLTRLQGKGRCATVHINARHSGAVDMRFYQGANQDEFETHWKAWYPGLADICHLSGPFTLALVTPIAEPSEQAIADFLHAHFLMCLSKTDTARWYVIAQEANEPNLPREMYFFVAAFILGSVVRYEPEQLMGMSGLESLEGWAIKKFVQVSERYFPQLVLNRIYSVPLII